ncbi:unnamed protein product (macronuclear) [Paramecium tetraurelia]|uniref:Transposase n=1 Tax=Paramecium tetraurelia TaxID=5888 RepID=A0BEG4_PARTE|nr:uncharacterized protein GSPATT00027964001 [Paramecium tetraurelia]CAK56931.1 unnamed protein product [Paramecium tetraurelia]|eukprot:XP_001424329.1 hypothetical protein (macronuclear) [Paramecium tetraurelia strain d4-2]
MFQLYENAENSTYSFEFKLDLTLLNVLRAFTHKDHEFQEGYLESIYALLYYYQGRPESELFSEYCAQKGNHTIESLIFQVHYYIGSLANLNQLVGVLKVDENKAIPLSRSDINKKNILSVHSISDRVGSINSIVLVSKSQTVKPEYLDLRVKICTYENKEEGVFSIDYNVLSLAIQAKGKLDPLVGSHLANKLNKMFKINLIQSGVIPRLPIAIASIFEENLKKNGTMVKMERKNVNAIKKWIEYTAKQYPAGSIIVQSTTYNSWPYPALIYKRGTGSNYIPMTFMGEEEGFAFREKTTFNYVTKYESSEIKLQDPTQQKTPQRSLKRAKSYIQVNEDYGFGYNTLTHQVQLQIAQSPTKSSKSGQPVRVQRGSILSQMDISNIATARENFRREVGPQFGFDLQQIGKHYVYIRQIRKQHKVLRNGQIVSLSAEHMYGWHTHVLAFGRYSKEEMAFGCNQFQ